MKKVLSFILCISLCIMYTLPVSAMEVISKENIIEQEEVSVPASSNYFSKILPKINSANGVASKIVTFSSGSISGNAQVVSISLYVRAGGDPFKLYLQAPDGTLFWTVMDATGTIGVDNFNVKNLNGTWNTWIETLGIASSATITAKIHYNYSY